ncbi:secreted RxLR effector peptide protein, putative [Phytophthora infestans T30-4]
MPNSAFVVFVILDFLNVLTAEHLVRTSERGSKSAIDAARNLKSALGATEAAGGSANAAEEERGWADVAEKLERTNVLKNAEEYKGEDAAKWQKAAKEVATRGKLERSKAAKARWANALMKLKAGGKVTATNEEKIEKVTEEAAQAIEKNPKKWPYIKKALEITFGVGIAAIIALGIEGMIGSSA